MESHGDWMVIWWILMAFNGIWWLFHGYFPWDLLGYFSGHAINGIGYEVVIKTMPFLPPMTGTARTTFFQMVIFLGDGANGIVLPTLLYIEVDFTFFGGGMCFQKTFLATPTHSWAIDTYPRKIDGFKVMAPIPTSHLDIPRLDGVRWSYPVVNIQKAMENHHFWWVNQINYFYGHFQ